MKIPSYSSIPIEVFLKEAGESLLPWFKRGEEMLGLKRYPLKKLAREVARLSEALIRGRAGAYMEEEWALRAYFAFYFPQGYLRTYFVLREMGGLLEEDFSVSTINDLGSGPGASLLAARDAFPRATLKGFERSGRAARFAEELGNLPVLKADFTRANIRGDVALAVSSLSEVGEVLKVVRRLWRTHRCLVVIEPGWSRGYSMIMELSRELGPPILPCGGYRCRLGRGDWCHGALPFRLPDLTLRLNSLLRHKLRFLKFTYGVFCRDSSLSGWGVRLRSPLIEEKGKSYYLACSQGRPIRLEFLRRSWKSIPRAFCCDLVRFRGQEVSPGTFRVEEFRVITSEVLKEDQD